MICVLKEHKFLASCSLPFESSCNSEVLRYEMFFSSFLPSSIPVYKEQYTHSNKLRMQGQPQLCLSWPLKWLVLQLCFSYASLWNGAMFTAMLCILQFQKKALRIPVYAIIHLNQHSSWNCAHWLRNVTYKNIGSFQKCLKRSKEQWRSTDLGMSRAWYWGRRVNSFSSIKKLVMAQLEAASKVLVLTNMYPDCSS